MIESQLRALFAEQVSSEPPPSRVSIEQARRQGRQRLRRRRAGLAGAPVLAVAAIAAVVLAGQPAPSAPVRAGATTPAASSSPSSSPASSSPAGGTTPTAAPGRFHPLIPYASFGWLPAGQSLTAGTIGPTEEYFFARPWSLDIYAASRPCKLTAARLNCTDGSGGLLAPVIGRAPAVHGHRAFWISGHTYLAWQYARGGWALLGLPPDKGARQQRAAVKVARDIRYGGATKPVIAFPAQLTQVPAQWRVDSVYYVPDAGRLRASQFSVTNGSISFDTDPATSRSSCYLYPDGQSVREVIGGYRVIITHLAASHGRPPLQQLCAAHADGLSVFISESGRHRAIGVVSLFTRHLRLLGGQPANWTTIPIR
jgi:hypothetical protein